MYITFRRDNLEFISASDTFNLKSNINITATHEDESIDNFGTIVYYDKFIIIENRPRVDYVETYFDEAMQTEEIVPGQFKFEIIKQILVNSHEKRVNVSKQAKIVIKDKVCEISNGKDLGFITAIKWIAERVLKKKASINELEILNIRTNVLNNGKDNGRDNMEIATQVIVYCDKILKDVNTVYSHYDRFLEDIYDSDSFSVDDIERKFINFKNSITGLI